MLQLDYLQEFGSRALTAPPVWCRKWVCESGQALQQQPPLGRTIVDGLEIVLSPQAAATEAYHRVDPPCATKTRNDDSDNETQTRGGRREIHTQSAHYNDSYGLKSRSKVTRASSVPHITNIWAVGSRPTTHSTLDSARQPPATYSREIH